MLELNPQNLRLGAGEAHTFVASGGVEPYIFSVQPGGPGGTIDPDTGLYTAPSDPAAVGVEVIEVIDAALEVATADLRVSPPLEAYPTRGMVCMGISAVFGGLGGVPYEGADGPYYGMEVLPGGAGGTIDQFTGIYTAPANQGIDVIRITDSILNTVEIPVNVGDAVKAVCDIIATELEIDPSRVWIWDQKIKEPTDEELFVVVGILACRPFGSSKRLNANGDCVQNLSMQATLSIDIKSRNYSAVARKEEVIMALGSFYAESQQELNNFKLATLPMRGGFVNLSNVDGAAIPYRFNISVNLLYAVSKSRSTPYFDNFQDVEVTTDA